MPFAGIVREVGAAMLGIYNHNFQRSSRARTIRLDLRCSVGVSVGSGPKTDFKASEDEIHINHAT
jgi:hypothetical protein